MATIIGTENDDDTTFLRSLFTGHGKALFGTNEDDSIYGLGGDDLLFAADGNDYLNGGSGADVMEGGDGDDVYIVDNVGDDVQEFGTTGHDEVVTSVSFTVLDGVEKLTLAATAGAINGTGNELDNDINGNDFANVLDGRAGDDDISGKNGNDTLFGGAGDDHLSGGKDNDILAGGLDNDTLDGGQGADQMFGGDGDDTYFVDNSGDVVSEFLGGGYDGVFSTVTFTLPSGVEGLVLEDVIAGGTLAGLDGTGNNLDNTISGGERNNTLRGLDGDDVLAGGGGNDTLFGGADNDTLYGEGDNDTLNGGSGADDMIGGTGNDTYVVDNVGDVVEELGNQGIDTVNVNDLVNYTLAANVENLNLLTGTNGTGNNLANVITGNLLDNILDGRGGSDTLIGGQGSDTASYEGNSGRVIVTLGANGADGSAVEFAAANGAPVSVDTLRGIENIRGSAFGDQITGNEGQNTITGGLGQDTMVGGGGADTFVWRSTAETGAANGQADIVADFNFADGDRIDLHLIDADGNPNNGNQDFVFINIGEFTAAGQVRFTFEPNDTFIQLNTDADAEAEATIHVLGAQLVNNNWFIL